MTTLHILAHLKANPATGVLMCGIWFGVRLRPSKVYSDPLLYGARQGLLIS